jgi:hypothetical protein
MLVNRVMAPASGCGDTHIPNQRHATRPCPPFRPAFNVSEFPFSTGFNGQKSIRPGNVRLADRTPTNPQKAESAGISIG